MIKLLKKLNKEIKKNEELLLCENSTYINGRLNGLLIAKMIIEKIDNDKKIDKIKFAFTCGNKITIKTNKYHVTGYIVNIYQKSFEIDDYCGSCYNINFENVILIS